MKLKYLFQVEYRDGSTFKQSAEDVSAADPKRSAFFDVRKEEVKRFTLVGGGLLIKDKLTVDLTDGHFEVNGTPFFMHDSATALKEMELVFHRQHTHHVNAASFVETAHIVHYCIGWRAKDEKGSEIKRVMEIL